MTCSTWTLSSRCCAANRTVSRALCVLWMWAVGNWTAWLCWKNTQKKTLYDFLTQPPSQTHNPRGRDCCSALINLILPTTTSPFISFFRTIILLWPCPLIQITWNKIVFVTRREEVWMATLLQQQCPHWHYLGRVSMSNISHLSIYGTSFKQKYFYLWTQSTIYYQCTIPVHLLWKNPLLLFLSYISHIL